MSEQTGATQPTTDAECIVCGYQLRGLDPEGKCPECGTPVERSLQGDLLRYADQDWLRSLHLGLKLLAWAMLGVVAVFMIILGSVIVELVVASMGLRAIDDLVEYLAWLTNGIWLMTTCALFAGLWLASTLEPREQNRDTLRPVLLRWTSIFVVPLVGVWFMSNASGAAVPAWLQITLGIAGFFAVVVHMTLFNDLLRALDSRCAQRDEKRRKLLRRYRVQGIGCAGLVMIIVAVAAIPRLIAGRAFDPTGLNLIIIVWLAVLSFARGTAKRIALERAIADSASADAPAAPATS